MKTPSFLILIFILFSLSCGTDPEYADNGVGGTGNVAFNGDDESGIGGTGKPVPNSGLGGTGKQVAGGLGGTGKSSANSGLGGTGKQVAGGLGGTGKSSANSGLGGTGKQVAGGLGGTGKQLANSGLGGTGIVGEVTGFGSIFVNGIEIEINNNSQIQSDNVVNVNVQPKIGDIVEILAQRVGDETYAEKINIRHEIVGPVDSINIKRHQFTIVGQSIRLNSPTMRLPKLGQMIAVSGLRDPFGTIHATRLSLSNSKSIWLIDTVVSSTANRLRLGRTYVLTNKASRYRKGDVLRVRASYRSGKLYAEKIYTDQAFGNKIQHMVLQGFINRGNRNNYKIGNVQFSTRSARIRSHLARNYGRWTRVEVQRNRIGLWQVEQFIGNSSLTRGSQLPLPMNNRNRLNKQKNSTTQSLGRQRFNHSISDDAYPTTTNPQSGTTNQTTGSETTNGSTPPMTAPDPVQNTPSPNSSGGMNSGNNTDTPMTPPATAPVRRPGPFGGMR